jgi:hypothetical protein
MKSYQIWLILAFALLLQNCGKNCTSSSEDFQLHQDKQIETLVLYDDLTLVYQYNIKDGEGIVFEYTFNAEQCDEVQDDEYGYRLAFSIDEDVEEFTFEDEELDQIKAFFQESGAWVSHAHREVRKGSITGEKRSRNRWSVKIDVEIPIEGRDEPVQVLIDEIFRN